jgi:hypothetical protein
LYWWVSVLTTPRNRKPVPLIDLQKNIVQNGAGKVEREINLVTSLL